MIAPQGEVYLGHVPWDSTYRHVYYEGMRDKSIIISAFMTGHTTNYTFIREDSNIRVPYNADNLYGINYCMYQNDGMWFCCFVNSVKYVNNNTALLNLQEDVWHTWGENLSFKACYVAREHVSTDALGQWRAPEPAMSLEMVVGQQNDFYQVIPDTVIVATNAKPHLKSGVSGDIFSVHSEDDFDGNDAVSGTLYSRNISGAKYYGFSTANLAPLSNFLDNLNKAGAAESVCALFMLNSHFLSVGSDHSVSAITEAFEQSYSIPQTLGGGYAPRNKKCLTFPYVSIVITDHNGGEMQLKAEDCDTWGYFTAHFRQSLDPTASVYFMPSGYMGQSPDQSHIMPVASAPQGSWPVSAYQNWVAQNAQTINNKHMFNSFGILGGILMTGVGVALIGSGIGAPLGGVLGEAGVTTVAAATIGAGIGGVANATQSEMMLNAQIDSQEKTPSHTVGGSSGNSLQGISRNCGGYRTMVLQRQSAERLDAFFDVFGYQVDTVKVPNVTGRPSWNYVKTVGANMGGAIPADRLSTINRCLDNGITFWHSASVGNYALSNAI